MRPVSSDPYLGRDLAHSLGVAALACVLSLGVVYAVYAVRVWRVAREAGHGDPGGAYVLVFGKRLEQGRPDHEFRRRLARARVLAEHTPERPLVLLGGGTQGLTEAAAGLRQLREDGLAPEAPIWLEDESRDTLQNLRNARALPGLPTSGPALLLSNRYHLARCAKLAEQLGIDYRLCAAEDRFCWREQGLGRLMTEAAYLCWLDLGTRWARLIGHQRMLSRVR